MENSHVEYLDIGDINKMNEIRQKRNTLETLLSYVCPQLKDVFNANNSSLACDTAEVKSGSDGMKK
jgi:hypothetical protein